MDTERRWPQAPLTWQRETWSRLEKLLSDDSFPHATLLAGPAAIGKQYFLLALAARALCMSPKAGTACGECRSCELLQAGSNPDLLRVEPEDDSRVIKIDQVRRLIEFAAQTPSLGPRKLIVLGPAELMNNNAANALLKCLEEPSASTTLLLYSHQPSALPATVRSRCQVSALPLPSAGEALSWLTQYTGDEATAADLLQLAAGRPMAARELFLEDRQDQERAVQKGLDALLEGKISALDFPQLVADLSLERVLSLLQYKLESLLRAAVMDGLRSQGREAFLLRDELARLRRSVANGANPNRQLAIEDCAGRLVQVVGDWP